jgi:hypothetical protein
LVQVPLVLAAARVVARRLAGCISQLLGVVVLPRCRNEEEDRGGMWRVGDGEEGGESRNDSGFMWAAAGLGLDTDRGSPRLDPKQN